MLLDHLQWRSWIFNYWWFWVVAVNWNEVSIIKHRGGDALGILIWWLAFLVQLSQRLVLLMCWGFRLRLLQVVAFWPWCTFLGRWLGLQRLGHRLWWGSLSYSLFFWLTNSLCWLLFVGNALLQRFCHRLPGNEVRIEELLESGTIFNELLTWHSLGFRWIWSRKFSRNRQLAGLWLKRRLTCIWLRELPGLSSISWHPFFLVGLADLVLGSIRNGSTFVLLLLEGIHRLFFCFFNIVYNMVSIFTFRLGNSSWYCRFIILSSANLIFLDLTFVRISETLVS